MTARADFLARIRREVAKAPGQFAASAVPRPPHPGAAAETIRRELTERWPQALERFREEFERIAGVFHRVPTLEAVPSVIAAIARERGASRLVTWDPAALGFDPGPVLSRDGLVVAAVRAGQEDDAARERHRAEAAAAQIGVTGADFALAETGTLILLSGAAPLDLAVARRPRGGLRTRPAARDARAGRRDAGGPSRRRRPVDVGRDDQLHHRAVAHRGHRAHADPGRARAQGSARDLRGGSMSERLFTPAEVNRLISRLTELMESVQASHQQALALQERLREDRARGAASGGERIDSRDWKARAERLDGLGIEVRQLLQEIAEMGGVTKDIEMGLVDFPGRGPAETGGATVNLCWKLGEEAVEFWHGMNEGYANRKPLP